MMLAALMENDWQQRGEKAGGLVPRLAGKLGAAGVGPCLLFVARVVFVMVVACSSLFVFSGSAGFELAGFCPQASACLPVSGNADRRAVYLVAAI